MKRTITITPKKGPAFVVADAAGWSRYLQVGDSVTFTEVQA